MESQLVDDLVDGLTLGVECDSYEIEIHPGDRRNGGAVCLVVVRREQLARVDGPA
jgi:hypothetical protein